MPEDTGKRYLQILWHYILSMLIFAFFFTPDVNRRNVLSQGQLSASDSAQTPPSPISFTKPRPPRSSTHSQSTAHPKSTSSTHRSHSSRQSSNNSHSYSHRSGSHGPSSQFRRERKRQLANTPRATLIQLATSRERSERRHGCEGGSAKISIAVGQCSIRAVSFNAHYFFRALLIVFLSEKLVLWSSSFRCKKVTSNERSFVPGLPLLYLKNELSFFRLKEKVAMNALKKVFTKDGRCMVLSTRPTCNR